jgi:hypothetical protein
MKTTAISLIKKIGLWSNGMNQEKWPWLSHVAFDFMKTYDKVNLTFLQEFMKVLGFSKYWIQWTTSLYKEVEMAMIMNGQQGNTFQLERYVWQGCPLMAYLISL